MNFLEFENNIQNIIYDPTILEVKLQKCFLKNKSICKN